MEGYKRLLSYLKPYWWIIAIATLFSLGTSAITGAMAWFLKPVIDGGIKEDERDLPESPKRCAHKG